MTSACSPTSGGGEHLLALLQESQSNPARLELTVEAMRPSDATSELLFEAEALTHIQEWLSGKAGEAPPPWRSFGPICFDEVHRLEVIALPREELRAPLSAWLKVESPAYRVRAFKEDGSSVRLDTFFFAGGRWVWYPHLHQTLAAFVAARQSPEPRPSRPARPPTPSLLSLPAMPSMPWPPVPPADPPPDPQVHPVVPVAARSRPAPVLFIDARGYQFHTDGDLWIYADRSHATYESRSDLAVRTASAAGSSQALPDEVVGQRLAAGSAKLLVARTADQEPVRVARYPDQSMVTLASLGRAARLNDAFRVTVQTAVAAAGRQTLAPEDPPEAVVPLASAYLSPSRGPLNKRWTTVVAAVRWPTVPEPYRAGHVTLRRASDGSLALGAVQSTLRSGLHGVAATTTVDSRDVLQGCLTSWRTNQKKIRTAGRPEPRAPSALLRESCVPRA